MKKFFIFLIAVVLCISLSSCMKKEVYCDAQVGLVSIPGSDILYYDNNTKIVYIIFEQGSGYDRYGYMSAYYASNGFPYHYDANRQELIEVPFQK